MDVRFDAIRPRSLLHELEIRARTGPKVIRLDLSALHDIDSTGVATLRAASRRLRRSGIAIELHGASPRVAHVLAATPEPNPPVPQREPGVLERVGRRSIVAWRGLLALADMTVEAMQGAVGAVVGRRSFSWRDVADQLERMGADALLNANEDDVRVVIGNLRRVSQDARALIRALRTRPSLLLRSTPPRERTLP